MTELRTDLAYQRYRTDADELMAIYTLGENRFTVLQDDAVTIVGRLLAGEDRLSVLKDVQEQHGPSVQSEVAEFLDAVSPLIFRSSGPKRDGGSRIRLESQTSVELTEEDAFFGHCANENLFAISAWELTYTCNLRCRHCYNPHHDASDQLETDQWLDLLDQARDMGMLRLSLTGGEVGTHPGFWRIVAKARSLHLAVDVLTNGLVFEDVNLAQELARLFPRSVQCSLYGATPATHDAITGVQGSWGRTMRCLRHFSALGVPLAVKCPAMQPNYREIPEVARLAEGLGAALQVDVNITARNDGDDLPTRMRLDEEALRWLFSQKGLPLYQGLERASLGNAQPPDPDGGVCGAGTNGLTIQPNGVVTPCLSFMLPLGRVPGQTLREIWRGDALTTWRRNKLRDRIGCDACDVLAHCSYCPGVALNDVGHALSRNPSDCRIAHVRAQVAHGLSVPK